MKYKSVAINLPLAIYDKIQKKAGEAGLTIEEMISHDLTIWHHAYPNAPDELAELFSHFTDDQLKQVSEQPMLPSEASRLDSLVEKAKRGALPINEKRELEALLERVNFYTLVRTEALVLLQQRGHEIKLRNKVKV